MSEQFLKDETRPNPDHVDAGDAGHSKSPKSRHVDMIAIGGAIGTGLFLGAGGRLADAGPTLFIAYAVCGVFAFLLVLMYADGGAGRTTVLCPPLIVAALVAGWYGIRARIARTSTEADA